MARQEVRYDCDFRADLAAEIATLELKIENDTTGVSIEEDRFVINSLRGIERAAVDLCSACPLEGLHQRDQRQDGSICVSAIHDNAYPYRNVQELIDRIRDPQELIPRRETQRY